MKDAHYINTVTKAIKKQDLENTQMRKRLKKPYTVVKHHNLDL